MTPNRPSWDARPTTATSSKSAQDTYKVITACFSNPTSFPIKKTFQKGVKSDADFFGLSISEKDIKYGPAGHGLCRRRCRRGWRRPDRLAIWPLLDQAYQSNRQGVFQNQIVLKRVPPAMLAGPFCLVPLCRSQMSEWSRESIATRHHSITRNHASSNHPRGVRHRIT